METAVAYAIPECGMVDFLEADDVAGYAHLLIASYQVAGGFFHSTKKDDCITAIESNARKWVEKCVKNASRMEIHKLPAVLSLFDWVYRLGYAKSPSGTFSDNCCRRIFHAWSSGNRLVSVFEIMHIVKQSPEIYKGSAADGLLWYAEMEKNWIRESVSSHSFANVPQNEALMRTVTLLGDDLGAFVPEQDAYKRKLVNKHLAALDDAGNCAGRLLKTMLLFVNRLCPDYISFEEHDRYASRLLGALSACPSINGFDRRAYSIALECRIGN